MIVQLSDVGLMYPGPVGVTALGGVSLTIEPGEMISLMGASGSGKTTLLSILGLLLRPTAGEYYFLGEPVARLDEARLSKLRNASLGFIFQHHLLLPELTALENVALSAVLAGRRSWSDALGCAAELLDKLGLSARAAHYPRQLSGGEAQRVAIGRALINNPDLILADEPTGNLDSENSRKIMAILRALHTKTHHTILVATHNPEISELCSRRIVLADGRIAHDDRAPVVAALAQ